jgi:hypothetical protein
MPVTKNVERVLRELRKEGVDVTTLERDLNKNPRAAKIVDRRILAQETFSEFQSNATKEKNKLKKKIIELGHLHDTANNLDEDDEDSKALLTSAKKRILALEDELKATGQFTDEEVEEFSMEEKRKIDAALSKSNNRGNGNRKKEIDDLDLELEEEEPVSRINKRDTRNLIDDDRLNDELAATQLNSIFGSVAVQGKIQTQLLKYQRVFKKEMPDEDVEKLYTKVIQEIHGGRKPEEIPQIADELFKYSEEQEKLNKTEREAELEKARTEGYSNAIKEHNIPARDKRLLNFRTMGSPAINTKRRDIQVLGEEVDPSGGTSFTKVKIGDEEIPVPRNKWGDAEVFRVRQQLSDRGNTTRYTDRFLDAFEKNGNSED